MARIASSWFNTQHLTASGAWRGRSIVPDHLNATGGNVAAVGNHAFMQQPVHIPSDPVIAIHKAHQFAGGNGHTGVSGIGQAPVLFCE